MDLHIFLLILNFCSLCLIVWLGVWAVFWARAPERTVTLLACAVGFVLRASAITVTVFILHEHLV